MPIDTSMYQNFKGGTGLASLAQGIGQGMDMANQMKQREMQAEQLKVQQAQAARQDEQFKLDQMDAQKKRSEGLFQNLGETSGQLLSIQDPAQQQMQYGSWRENMIKNGMARPQDLPEEFQAARPMAEFYHGKYQRAQQEKDRDFNLRERELSQRGADRREAREGRLFQQSVQRETKHQEKVEQDVQKLSDKLGNAQELGNALAGVDSQLGFGLDSAEVKNGKLLVAGKEKDLPGVSLPFVGRVSAYSGDARNLESAVAKVFNTELKDRSGAAVTTPELERLKIEFGSGKFNTEPEMVQALQNYKKIVSAELKNREAAFRPEVLQTYRERGGATSERFKSAQQATPGQMAQQDRQAIEWAMNNPADPRAAQILKKNGVAVGGN